LDSFVSTNSGHRKLKTLTSSSSLLSIDKNRSTNSIVLKDFGITNKIPITLKTSSGKIVGSEDHKVKTSVGWKRIKDINVGDKIETLLRHSNFSDDNLTNLNSDLSFLLGAFIGDGSYGKKCSFAGIDVVLNNKIISIVNSYFPDTKISIDSYKQIRFSKYDKSKMGICSLHLFLIENLGRVVGQNKNFPDKIYNSGKANILSFLSGLLMTDGSVTSNHIEFSSYIYKNVLDYGYLLQGFGIPFHISEQSKSLNDKSFVWYKVTVDSLEGIRFFQNNLPLISYKGERLLNIDISKKQSFIKYDSSLWNIIVSEIKSSGYKSIYDFCKSTKINNHHFLKTHQDLSFDYLVGINSFLKSPVIDEYINSDVYYKKVLSKSIGETSIEMMDIEVFRTHNFIVSNFVVHNSAEEALSLAEKMLESGLFSIVILDSVAAMLTKRQLSGDIGDATIGEVARIMSASLPKINKAASATNTAMLFINQTRSNIGVFSPVPGSTTTPGGKALKFYCSLRIEIKKRDFIVSGENTIGQEMRFTIRKNKFGRNNGYVDVNLYYNHGFKPEDEIVDLCKSKGIIEARGAWIFYKDLKWNGSKALIEAVKNDKTLFLMLLNAYEELAEKERNSISIEVLTSGGDSDDIGTEEEDPGDLDD
jgi:protein RecA